MLDFFHQGRNRKRAFVEDDSVEKPNIVILHHIPDSQNLENFSCGEGFDCRIVDLCSLHQSLDIPIFPGIATFFAPFSNLFS